MMNTGEKELLQKRLRSILVYLVSGFEERASWKCRGCGYEILQLILEKESIPTPFDRTGINHASVRSLWRMLRMSGE